MAKRVVDGDARAHKWSRLFCRQIIGDCGYGCRGGDHVLGIATIEIEARDFAIDAHREIATPAVFANETMAAVPADADTLTLFPFLNVAPDRIDASRDLMTWHPGILHTGP